MTYGYSADILEDLEMTYMDEYEFMESVMEEMERVPVITHDEYAKGIEAITFAGRKALLLDLIENWALIYYGKAEGHDVLERIVEKHQCRDTDEIYSILGTIEMLFSI